MNSWTDPIGTSMKGDRKSSSYALRATAKLKLLFNAGKKPKPPSERANYQMFLADEELTFEMEAFKVRPSQFYGLELNERAVAIAQLVLWIGYFQWHKKTTGTADTKVRPLLPKQQTIIQQDAVLAYDAKTPRKRKVELASSRLHSDGGNKVEVASSCLNSDKKAQQDAAPTIEEFVCIWDGRTTKPHPVTGKEVPDESVTIPVYDYANPRLGKVQRFGFSYPIDTLITDREGFWIRGS